MRVKSVSVMLGRDYMCDVLEPLLGLELARERANNIAQVLALAARDPERVAFGMLRDSGLSDLAPVAAALARAWLAAQSSEREHTEVEARGPAREQNREQNKVA
jgi:hypothetical protein